MTRTKKHLHCEIADVPAQGGWPNEVQPSASCEHNAGNEREVYGYILITMNPGLPSVCESIRQHSCIPCSNIDKQTLISKIYKKKHRL